MAQAVALNITAPTRWEIRFADGLFDKAEQPFIGFNCTADDMREAWAKAKHFMTRLGVDRSAARVISFKPRSMRAKH